MYRCPRAVKEDSPTRLSFFCLMFTSLASEPTPNRLILRRSWRCCWQTRPFTIASTGPTQRSSRLLDGLIWGAAFTSVLFGNWKHGCFYFGMEIQISLGFFVFFFVFSLTFKHTLPEEASRWTLPPTEGSGWPQTPVDERKSN